MKYNLSRPGDTCPGPENQVKLLAQCVTGHLLHAWTTELQQAGCLETLCPRGGGGHNSALCVLFLFVITDFLIELSLLNVLFNLSFYLICHTGPVCPITHSPSVLYPH